MVKRTSFARDFKKADAQRRAQVHGPALDAIEAEATAEHMQRRAGFKPEVKKHEKPRSEREKGSRGGHLSVKGALNAKAIDDVSQHVSPGTAIRLIDSKRGSRSRQRKLVAE